MTFRIASIERVVALLLVPLLALSMVPPPALAQAPPAPQGEQGWPRQFQSGSITFTAYQPQLESWKWRDLAGRVALSVRDAVSPQERFGVIWFMAKTNVSRAGNLGTLEDIAITKESFPATPESWA